MGWNTTVVVMNDSLSNIENDPDFGKNLGSAIREHVSRRKERVDVRARGAGNAASVIAQAHADVVSVVLVGGNYGRVIAQEHNGGNHKDPEDQVKLLREAARKLGYSLVPLNAVDELAELA
jgi:hypothetical protein